ncbi:MAG: dihydrodipicolinate synthase family protein [Rhodospirillales bacterium]|nr:dihydrodipicolinate synthase family protein [Rhodospirillales bacterium]
MNDLEAKKEKLFGNHVLLVTPMLPSGEIDEKSTRNLVDFVIDKGVHEILVLCSTGECFCLTESERKQFIEIVIYQTGSRVPVGVGVNDSSSDTSAQLAKHAAKNGIDYIFTTGYYFHPHGSEGIYRHDKYVAGATDLPVIVYDCGAGI